MVFSSGNLIQIAVSGVVAKEESYAFQPSVFKIFSRDSSRVLRKAFTSGWPTRSTREGRESALIWAEREHSPARRKIMTGAIFFIFPCLKSHRHKRPDCQDLQIIPPI